ncbi:MAG: tRNA adenosine(34) deaminase TadA [Desulfosalsimonas sp.]
MDSRDLDNQFMAAAIEQAQKAAACGEVPVGAVVADNHGGILASAFNQSITMADPTAHAEILAIRSAARRTGNYRLLNTTLYATIEPCPMCMGAVIHARIARVVFGAFDPKWGAAGSLYDFAGDRRFNHRPEIVAGVRIQACRTLLIDFFAARRGKNSL